MAARRIIRATGKGFRRESALFVLLVVSGSAVFAQDEGGLAAVFDVSQTVEAIDEEGFSGTDGSGLRSLTALSFGLTSRTRSQSFGLDASSGLAVDLGDEGDTTFENNRATLEYTRSNRNAELSFGGRYRRDNIDDLAFDDTLADNDIETGVGQREVLSLTSGLVLGREARVTATLGHSYETSVFFDTLDPSLNDAETQAFDARGSFQLTRTLTADVFGAWRDVDEQGAGATDRTTGRIGTAASYLMDPATTLSAEVSYSEEQSLGVTPLATEGWNYNLSATRTRSDGVYFVDFSQEDALTGTRRQLTAGHDRTLSRGELGYSLGVSSTEEFGPQVLASLTFTYEADRNSTANIALSQAGTINGDDQDVVNSRLNLSYTRALSSVAQIGTSFDLADENVLNSDGVDQRTFRFDVTFDYDLTPDWGLTTGYGYSVVALDGTEDRSRSAVFVGLQRTFSYRP